jgi:hypothetical protein
VVIITPGVPTPRAVMQAWLASMTTATPFATFRPAGLRGIQALSEGKKVSLEVSRLTNQALTPDSRIC